MTTDSTTGRRIEEIVITPEMIEAGVSAIDPLDRGLISDFELVSLIYGAMARAAPPPARLSGNRRAGA
jgi:hypothetical protein